MLNVNSNGHQQDALFDGDRVFEVRQDLDLLVAEYGLVITHRSRSGLTVEGFFDPKKSKTGKPLVRCLTYRVDVVKTGNHIQKFDTAAPVGTCRIVVPTSGSDGISFEHTNKNGHRVEYPLVVIKKTEDRHFEISNHENADKFRKWLHRDRDEETDTIKKTKNIVLLEGDFKFSFDCTGSGWEFIRPLWKSFFAFPTPKIITSERPRIYEMMGCVQEGKNMLGINPKHGYVESSEIFPHSNIECGGKLPNGWWSEPLSGTEILLYKQKQTKGEDFIHACIVDNTEEWEQVFPTLDWAIDSQKCIESLRSGLEKKKNKGKIDWIIRIIQSMHLEKIKELCGSGELIALTRTDSINAGNCVPGTDEFIKRHEICGNVLLISDISSEMWGNRGLQRVLAMKIAGAPDVLKKLESWVLAGKPETQPTPPDDDDDDDE